MAETSPDESHGGTLASRKPFPVVDDSALEPLDYLLLAYDDLLEVAGTNATPPSATLAGELATGLADLEECVRWLEAMWPRRRRRTRPAELRESSSPSSPVWLGNYELLGEIARGGMGVVYRARQRGLKRIVALKTMLAGQFASEAAIRRFLKEAEAAARLQHPDIVPIHEIGHSGGQYFFSMSLIEGISLDQRLKQGPLALTDAVALTQRVAAAISYAHGQGIVHRDLKPHNVLLDERNEPKITDFGLAKHLDDQEGLTATGDVLGTPSYMAPEQAAGQGEDVGPLADVYSLGAILYATLTGRPPFQAATLAETLRQVIKADPVSPSLVNPAVPRDLETICLKCLRKSPAQRYASAAELADDLARFARGEAIRARPLAAYERWARWLVRHPGTASLLALAVVVCGLLIAGFEYRSRSQEWQRTAEARAETIKERTIVAEQQRELAARRGELAQRNLDLANLAMAMRHMSRAGELASRRAPGWSWEALDELRRASELSQGRLEPIQIDSLTAECRGALDLRPVAVLAAGVRPTAFAFSPDSRLVAIAQYKGSPTTSVFVVDVVTHKIVERYSLDTLADNVTALVGNLFQRGSTGMFQDGMYAVAFSPDQRWVAAGTRRGKVCLWDRTGQFAPEMIPAVESDFVKRLAFSPDSQVLFADYAGRFPMRRWIQRETSWEALQNLPGTRGRFALAADGLHLATADKGFQLFHLRSAEWRTDLPATPPGDLSWLPGTQTIVLTHSREHRIVDAMTGRTGRVLQAAADHQSEAHEGTGHIVASRGLLFQPTDADVIRVIDLASDRELSALGLIGQEKCPIAVSPDGRWLVVAEDDASRLYEIRGDDVHAIAVHSLDSINDFDISPDGQRLAHVAPRFEQKVLRGNQVETTSLTGTTSTSTTASQATAWNAHGGHPYSEFRPRAIRDVGLVRHSPHSDHIAVACELTGLHWQEPGQTPRWPAQLVAGGFPTRVIEERELKVAAPISPMLQDDATAYDGRTLSFPCQGEPREWRIQVPLTPSVPPGQSFSIVARVRADAQGINWPALRAATGDGQAIETGPLVPGEYVWVHGGVIRPRDTLEAVEIRLGAVADRVAAFAIDRVMLLPMLHDWEKQDWQELPCFRSVVFTSDGESLVAILQQHRVAWWDIHTGELQHSFVNQGDVVVSGKGGLQCLTELDGTVWAGSDSGRVWRLTRKASDVPSPLDGPGGTVTSLAVNPATRLLAIGTSRGKLRLLPIDATTPLADLDSPGGQLDALVFDSAGQRLWSGGRDGALRCWEPVDGLWKPTLVLTAGEAPVKALRMVPQTGQLAVLRENQTVVHLWNTNGLVRSAPRH